MEKRREYLREKGVRIEFNDAKPSSTTIPKICAKPMFWYLENLFLPHGKKPIEENEITDSILEIYWFRYYPFKGKKK